MNTIHFVIFPHCPWGIFPFPNLISSLLSAGSVSYVTTRTDEQLPADVSALSPSAFASFDKTNSVAIVTHPYWLYAIAPLHPSRLVVLLPESCVEEHPVWKMCWQYLTARADLVCTFSEMRYLETTLRCGNALLLQADDGPDRQADYEAAFLQACLKLLSGQPLDTMHADQWQERSAYYRLLREQVGPHETISFLLSVYSYLLGREEAASSLLEAFAQAVLAGRDDCLLTHYRFLSAIYAGQNQMEAAVKAYGITALSQEDRDAYARLCDSLAEGNTTYAKAMLFYLNDDYQAALTQLEFLFSDAASPLRFSVHLAAGNLQAALESFPADAACNRHDHYQFLLLQGALEAMQGKRYEANRRYLQAAALNQDALVKLLELDAIDGALAQLLNQGAGEDVQSCDRESRRTDSEKRGQQTDRHDAGAQ